MGSGQWPMASVGNCFSAGLPHCSGLQQWEQWGAGVGEVGSGGQWGAGVGEVASGGQWGAGVGAVGSGSSGEWERWAVESRSGNSGE